MACKILGSVVAFDGISYTDKYRFRLYHTVPFQIRQRIDIQTISNGHLFGTRLFSSYEGFWNVSRKPYFTNSKHSLSCHSAGSEATQCATKTEDLTATSSDELEDAQVVGNGPVLFDQKTMHGSTSSNQGLAEAFKFMYNDAQFVNDRARNDMILLSRGITRLNDRACEDVAFLGLEFLKLDARAREDTEKIDHGMRRKAACLNHIATMLKDKAHSKLKTAADRHWSNGALEADLRRADFCFRRRAMEDAYMALKFVRNIHDIMANKLQQQPKKQGPPAVSGMMGIITLEKNGKAFDLFSREVSTERITAIQEAYWSMASALSEADGIDYSDPEELELLVATLIDLDAMDGKSSVSLLAECSSSPDVDMRQALANALAAAPSVWILGNAGMGALQRLAQDSNPAVAAAASKAIHELKQQWELEEGDNLRFMMNQLREKGAGDETDTEAGNS